MHHSPTNNQQPATSDQRPPPAPTLRLLSVARLPFTLPLFLPVIILVLLTLSITAIASAETPPRKRATGTYHQQQPGQPVEQQAETDETDELATLDAAQRIPHSRVALARAMLGKPDLQEVARTTPLDVQVGDVQEFWVTNMMTDRNYTVTAELRYAGPVVLMYVEQGFDVDQSALEEAARNFEQNIYPRTRETFGSEWQPGVDGDPRITVLNTQNRGDAAIGYFSPRDSSPRAVNRFSNEREMFYMKLNPGGDMYLSVLAHEFQHMIHWNEQRVSATWFNEGCSTLSQDLNGFKDDTFAQIYLAHPDTQLTTWTRPPSSIMHYGAANLFMRYLYSQYAGSEGIQPLIETNASNNLDAFVALAATRHADIASFKTLFGNWAVANLLNDPTLAEGQYAYNLPDAPIAHTIPDLLPDTVSPRPIETTTFSDTVQQFGVRYLALPDGPLTVDFQGDTSVKLTGGMPRGTYAWWSGRGDNSVATLTRQVDLRHVPTAKLYFSTWYEIETDYDYAFITVSTDGGTTWHTLSGRHTTTHDPQGANYGHGLTGISSDNDRHTSSTVGGAWVEERIDLTPYVGSEVLLRFWQVNDEGLNEPGWMLDTIRLCMWDTPAMCWYRDDVETVETNASGWDSQGFVRVDGDLAQQWEVRLVRTAPDGSIAVETLAVDGAGHATTSLDMDEQGVLVIAPVTPYTTETANYRLELDEPPDIRVSDSRRSSRALPNFQP
jgi:hypothetical protein